jgi:hypothetical protein
VHGLCGLCFHVLSGMCLCARTGLFWSGVLHPPGGGVASCSAQPNLGGGLGARSSYSILDALKVTSCAAYYPELVGVLHIVINVGSAASQGISRANCCGYVPRDA